MSLLLVFQIARLLPLFVLLGYASVLDLKYGVVPNRVWLYAPVGFVLVLLEWVIFTPSMAAFGFM